VSVRPSNRTQPGRPAFVDVDVGVDRTAYSDALFDLRITVGGPAVGALCQPPSPHCHFRDTPLAGLPYDDHLVPAAGVFVMSRARDTTLTTGCVATVSAEACRPRQPGRSWPLWQIGGSSGHPCRKRVIAATSTNDSSAAMAVSGRSLDVWERGQQRPRGCLPRC
jgi:hypothetical protein